MIKKYVLEFLDNPNNRALSYKELANEIKLQMPQWNVDDIMKNIIDLENEFLIIKLDNNKLYSLNRLNLVVGEVEIKKRGFGFIRCETFDVFVAKDKLNGALNKDRVFVKLEKNTNKNNKEGSVFRVISHGYDLIVGEVVVKKNHVFVVADDTKIDKWIRIEKNATLNASEGHKVVCYLTKTDSDNNIYGKIKSIIGHVNDVGVDILSIVYQHGFNPEFSQNAIEEATSLSEKTSEIGNRTDLRDKLTITIDGADAKDLDDAICLEINDRGNRVLYVSIADVSYYVREKSELDKEAYVRSTSVYLADRVVPMIPHQISNGICSLLEGVDRLTQTCEMEFDNKGNLISYNIYESIINSTHRMTYDEVNSIFERDRAIEAKYSDVVDTLYQMLGLSKQLRVIKEKRGMLNFNVPEAKVIVDKKGNVSDIVVRERKESEMVIEDFMIVANETVAEHIYWMELPFIYRVHEKPREKKITDFLSYASLFNLKIKGKVDNLTSKDVQKLLRDINKKDNANILHKLLLRSMSKAHYQPQCIGHFGLASKYYTHFTSPIRRYPDLIVHRLLRKYIYDGKELNRDKEMVRLEKIGEQTSRKERDAIEAERDVNELKMAEFMKDKVGEIFFGNISSVTSFGFFVELENTVEGLVHISTLNDDHYNYQSKYHMLVGERTGKQYKIGEKVKVKLDSVNIKDRDIDFIISK